jgi:hypothetical protein
MRTLSDMVASTIDSTRSWVQLTWTQALPKVLSRSLHPQPVQVMIDDFIGLRPVGLVLCQDDIVVTGRCGCDITAGLSGV